ncbi:MAG TPA: pitrilysin family protein [Candidatus Solibacter sp.]|nr:pitrilysin family protein [Candidatus Solibacter sp.]
MTRTLSVLLLGAAAALAQPPRPPVSYRNLKFPPPARIKAPEPVRFQLANGIVVYLMEDHELPTVAMNAMVRTGSFWEPVSKAGLAGICATVMRTGGSTTRNGDQLDRELDRLGASVETSSGGDSNSAGFFVLKEDVDKAVPILADILQRPAFPEDKIELAKIDARASIDRRNDDPGGIAGREYNRAMYGKNSPFAHQAEYATINAITRDDLIAFHKQFYQPESIILGAWGDFDSAAMRTKIEHAFGGWQRGGRERPKMPAAEVGGKSGVYLIDKEDATQSTVIAGLPGGRMDDPDFFAATVMNNILGNGFASRLFAQVRTVQGLAYAIGSSWDANWEYTGTFNASGGSKSETTVKFIRAVQREIQRMSQDPVTPTELARGKDNILKGIAFDFDSTAKIATRLMMYEYYGYPRDFLQRYQEGIAKVTADDVVRVAKKYLNGELAIMVVGKEKDFDAPLNTLGKVTRVDITIPK